MLRSTADKKKIIERARNRERIVGISVRGLQELMTPKTIDLHE
jgi:hypothetical protein